MLVTRGKKGHPEEEDRDFFWRGTAIEVDIRLRVRRAIGKIIEEVVEQLPAQLRARGHWDAPPAIATDGKGSYREAMVETWGQVSTYSGRGRPLTRKQPQPGWPYLQGVKPRSGSRVIRVSVHVVYGSPEEVRSLLGQHTVDVARTHLPSRQMNGRLVRKTLSYSKQVDMLKAASTWDDWVYNLTRPVETWRVEVNDGQRRWQPRSPAMAAGLTVKNY